VLVAACMAPENVPVARGKGGLTYMVTALLECSDCIVPPEQKII